MPEPVERSATRLLAACLGSLGTSLCFLLLGLGVGPVPLYLPLSRRWTLTPAPGEPAMDFYGRSLLALLAGGACALCGYLLGKRWRVPVRLLRFLALYALAALGLAAGLYGYQLIGRVPAPEPLPAAAPPA